MTASPLVAAYLADLDRALAGADPADRLEIVDAVREHIEASLAELGASPTQAEVAGVLRRLGTADDVAAAWAAGTDRPGTPQGAWSGGPQLRPSAHGLAPTPPDEARPATSPWLVALVVILGLAFGGPLVLALLGALFLVPVRVGGGVISIVVGGLAVAATVGCGIAWRRSTTHRRAWLIAFLVGLVVILATVIGFGAALASSNGVSGGTTPLVGPGEVVAPTPSPGSDGIPLTIP